MMMSLESTAQRKTMRAVVQDRYGPPEVLSVGRIEVPAVGDDDVLVRVHAAGVDAGVWHLTAGLPLMVRLMGYGLRRPKARVPGSDLAGRVEAVGGNVTLVKPGDEVFGVGAGSFAEFTLAREDRLAPKPANLTFEEAAAVPISAVAALQGLRDRGGIQSGQEVLIIGAGGGVGTFAVQLAKAFGARVTGVCSTTKLDLVRSLGADEVIDYTSQDITDRGGRFDLILDTGGNRRLSHLRRALAPRGTLVLVGGEGGGRWLGGVDRILRAVLWSPFVGQRLRGMYSTERREDLLVLTEMIEARRFAPVIDRTYPLAEASDAVRQLESGHGRGKSVVTV
jgi:NADPH:quinone reductase-like Zn-dependent oxidoreductase